MASTDITQLAREWVEGQNQRAKLTDRLSTAGSSDDWAELRQLQDRADELLERLATRPIRNDDEAVTALEVLIARAREQENAMLVQILAAVWGYLRFR